MPRSRCPHNYRHYYKQLECSIFAVAHQICNNATETSLSLVSISLHFDVNCVKQKWKYFRSCVTEAKSGNLNLIVFQIQPFEQNQYVSVTYAHSHTVKSIRLLCHQFLVICLLSPSLGSSFHVDSFNKQQKLYWITNATWWCDLLLYVENPSAPKAHGLWTKRRREIETTIEIVVLVPVHLLYCALKRRNSVEKCDLIASTITTSLMIFITSSSRWNTTIYDSINNDDATRVSQTMAFHYNHCNVSWNTLALCACVHFDENRRKNGSKKWNKVIAIASHAMLWAHFWRCPFKINLSNNGSVRLVRYQLEWIDEWRSREREEEEMFFLSS